MTDVDQWLRANDLDSLIGVFEANDIDFEVLFDLTDADLKELGLTLGKRKKLMKLLNDPHAISRHSTTLQPTENVDQSFSIQQDAERRQLTVMFVDLVASTAMSTQMDPEELRSVLNLYQNTVAGAISRFEGNVAKYMGDGVLAYFGWPKAHEDDAERAVRTALAVMQDLASLSLPNGMPMMARIGIATGLVIVGDLIGEGSAREETVVGETPNLAARLQGAAEPGEIVIAATTRKLVGDTFEILDEKTYTLKGIAAGTKAYVVSSEKFSVSRFEARHSGNVGEMVGRDNELGLIMDRWQRAQQDDGQLVFLSGEAGIGKSRVTRAMIDAAGGCDHTRISYQCSPYHADSAFYPAIQQLTHGAGISPADSNDDKLDRLEAFLLGDDKQPIAQLLGLATEQRYGPPELDSQKLRLRTLKALSDELVVLSEANPVLFVLEDAHWIDATTLEMIELCLDKLHHIPVLILMTARPTFECQFSGHPCVTHLALNRLSRGQISLIATALAGGKALPADLLDEVSQKTDGVPLFVEELTKTVLESGVLIETDGQLKLRGPVSSIAIPATLHDSLMARLDRLQPVKEVAQMAACIGREFDRQLLLEISPQSDDELKLALERLIEAELIFRRGLSPEGSYIFKHALVRDAAYESLLKTRRKAIHGDLLTALEARDQIAPELLANHATHSGNVQKAIDYWQLAGEQARLSSAVFEAIAHFGQARLLLTQQPPSEARDERELELLKLTGSVCIAAHGYGAPETISVFDAALELSDRIDRPDLRFPVLYGQYVYRYIQGGGAPPAYDVAKRMLDEAENQSNSIPKMIGHRCVGMTLFCQGKFGTSKHHFEQTLNLHGDEIDHNLIFDFGTDSKVSAQSFMSTILLLEGFCDQAGKLCDHALTRAKQSKNVHTLEYALFFGPLRHFYCMRDLSEFERHSTELGSVANENRLPMWQAYASTQIGWLLSQKGEHDAGISRIVEGLTGLRKCGVAYDTPLAIGQLAEAYLIAGRPTEGLEAIDQALAAVAQTNERWFEPEIYRLKGELLAACAERSVEEIGLAFQKSLELARALDAKWWKLRTAGSLYRQAASSNGIADEPDLLKTLYESFTEGLQSADLTAARRLLDQA